MVDACESGEPGVVSFTLSRAWRRLHKVIMGMDMVWVFSDRNIIWYGYCLTEECGLGIGKNRKLLWVLSDRGVWSGYWEEQKVLGISFTGMDLSLNL